MSEILSDEEFSRYMNKPLFREQEGYVSEKNGERFVHCPYCNKSQFPVGKTTKIQHLRWKCKNNKCKIEFDINV